MKNTFHINYMINNELNKKNMFLKTWIFYYEIEKFKILLYLIIEFKILDYLFEMEYL